jgi:(E)-4-hydroxy-3-methylbut-2-enyl-diphosphate synthase
VIKRHPTREVRCGKLVIGGAHPIWVQSLTTTKTSDTEATKAEIRRMLDAGCEIVRVSCFDQGDAQSLGAIKAFLPPAVPLVSDIHFNTKFGLEAIRQGVDKVRLNPGNVGGKASVFDDEAKRREKEVADAAKRAGICMRVGVNSGSVEQDLLDKYGYATADAIYESAVRHCEWLEACGFRDIVVSLKSTSMETVVEAYLRFGRSTDIPMHVGVTEAGLPGYGTIKSAIGIGRILLEGLGDTIRVSLTGDKALEVHAGFDILKATGRRVREPEIVACPLCGRAAVQHEKLVTSLKERISDLKVPMRISILACAVNGPGEAAEADIGAAGERGQWNLFKQGKPLRRVKDSEVLDEMEKEVRKLAAEMAASGAAPGGHLKPAVKDGPPA